MKFPFRKRSKRLAGSKHLPVISFRKIKERCVQTGEELSLSSQKRLELERERLLRGEKPKSFFSNKQQRTAARLLAGFFVMIFALTLLARGATSLAVARVTAGTPKSGVITQRYTLSGMIEAQDSLDIMLPAGLRLTGILAQVGDRVEEGDPLLQIDAETLQEVIEQLQNEIRILDLKISNLSNGISSADTAQIQQAEQDLAYAKQDYDRLMSNQELSSSRLNEDLAEAQANYDEALIALENAKIKAKDTLIEDARAKVSTAEKALSDAEYNRTEAIASAEAAVEAAEEAESSAENAYNNAVAALRRAEEALQQAKDHLAALQAQDPPATAEELATAQSAVDSAQTQVDNAQDQVDNAANNLSGSAAARARENLKRVKERQKQLVAEAEDALEQAEDDLIEAKNKTDFSDDALVVAAQSGVDSAQAALKTAQRNIEDAGLSREEQLLNAQRAIESAEADLEAAKKQVEKAQQADETTRKQNEAERLQYSSERSQKQSDLEQLEALSAQGGMVTAPVAGTVKTAPEQAGVTQDSTATVTLARADQSFEFSAMVDQKTAEQLAVGDEGTLSYTNAGSSQSAVVQISSIGTPNEDGEVRISAQLKDGSFSSGTSASLEVEKYSQQYPMLLPLSALRTINGKSVVLVVREQQSVMGAEQTVEEMEVTVKAQDSENMAVEGALLPDDRVVISASKPVEKGDRVRVEG